MSEHRGRAFTFLEIMLVVLIIGILVSIVAFHGGDRAATARIQASRMAIANAEAAIDQFRLDHGRLPQSLDELVHPPVDALEMGEEFYLETHPLDAWNRDLVFWVPPEHFGRVYDLYSPGPNGIDDRGEGDDVRPARYELEASRAI